MAQQQSSTTMGRIPALPPEVMERIIYHTLARSNGVTYVIPENGEARDYGHRVSLELPEFIRALTAASKDLDRDVRVGCDYIKDLFHKVRVFEKAPKDDSDYEGDSDDDDDDDLPGPIRGLGVLNLINAQFDHNLMHDLGGITQVEDDDRIVATGEMIMDTKEAFCQCRMASNLAVTAYKLRRVNRTFFLATGGVMREFRDGGFPASLADNDLLEDDISKFCDEMEKTTSALCATAAMSVEGEEAAMKSARLIARSKSQN